MISHHGPLYANIVGIRKFPDAGSLFYMDRNNALKYIVVSIIYCYISFTNINIP